MTMEVETAVAEDITTTEVAAEPTEQEAEAKESAPTREELQAALEAKETAYEKLANQLKSAQGVLKGRLDTGAELKAIRRELANTKAYLQALAKGQVSGDPATTQAELDAAQAAAQHAEAQEGFNAEAQDLSTQIREDMEDAGLEPTSPELSDAVAAWNDWLRTQDIKDLKKAAKITREVRRNVQMADFEKQQAQERKKSGSLTTPNIRASGSGGSNYIQKLKSGDSLPSAEEIDRLTARYVNK